VEFVQQYVLEGSLSLKTTVWKIGSKALLIPWEMQWKLMLKPF
jgi:hypothetical protein